MFGDPAIVEPIIDNWVGGVNVSECITANPSIVELSNPGSFTFEWMLLKLHD